MNDVTVFIFLVCFVAIFGATFAFMWKMMTTTISDLNKPITKTRIPAPHPEMEGVGYGEELMVFKLEDVDDEDDDGDIVVRP